MGISKYILIIGIATVALGFLQSPLLSDLYSIISSQTIMIIGGVIILISLIGILKPTKNKPSESTESEETATDEKTEEKEEEKK
ncbi:MAG: hypothetical protein KAI55_00055 [Candidatus Aenigmarchaeota archaeon]|nr:hypothetical protein [Candidatus Aenigmarchaeota archaeon]